MSIDTPFGSKVFQPGVEAQLVGTTAARLGMTLQNNSDSEFRYVLGSQKASGTLGFRLLPGRSQTISGIISFDKKDAATDYFTGPVSVLVLGNKAARLDFLEIVSV